MNPGSLLTAYDLHLFHEGSHGRLYEKMGGRLHSEGGVCGVRFGVWAPNAERVTVVGDFNAWDKESHPLEPAGESGV